MFHCREEERNTMQRLYEKDRFACVILYGRRRVGKTALINEFCRDKPTIFFSALNATAQENLEELSRSIRTYENPLSDAAPIYESYPQALDAVTALSQNQRLIFVIDEYPYLAKAEPSISSRLQHLIDHVWQESRIYVILCGSSMSFMEHQVLGYESPLYGRRTAQIRLQPLTYRETALFCPELGPEDQALLYGVTGGIPHYINMLDVEDNLDEALLENLFHPAGYLFEEPQNLLKQELREPALYNSIISAVAGGASRLNEIATKVALESGICSKYLYVLMSLGILRKETPIAEKPGRKTLYGIEDNFFRFWYRFVPRNMSLISSGRIREVYDRAIRPYYADYMGLIFEKMCREYLMRYARDLPFVLREVGQWWGTDPKARREVQIDIVGLPVEGDRILIGSCKYRSRPAGEDELELMKYYARVFRPEGCFCYYIFSKGGFTKGLREKERNGEVRLVTLEEMYEQNDSRRNEAG